jgi:alkanesulfonate monooxygenase SsuD/methylene tetrahydromethanopterin reductase-like flavin-dependent oxidoreductase (luciferase family)
MAIKLGIVVTTGEPRIAADLAASAEAHGWDGVFTWDGVALGSMDTYDPWVVMAAMAMRTERVRLGAIVTPPARRRPWKLARETMTLDRLSNGRLVLPVGLGTTDDAAFGNVGEPTEARARAERLDESLAILAGLWTGELFGFAGRHYRFEPMTFRPTPVQQPRIPIWVVGAWPHERSLRRTLAWDGIYAQVEGTADFRQVVDWAERAWPAASRDRSWDVVVEGRTAAHDRAGAAATVAEYASAGATWWIESDWENGTVDTIRRRIEAGPPRPDG